VRRRSLGGRYPYLESGRRECLYVSGARSEAVLRTLRAPAEEQGARWRASGVYKKGAHEHCEAPRNAAMTNAVVFELLLRLVTNQKRSMKISEYRGWQPAINLNHGPLVARYGANALGRDFVVGDLHGMFAHLRVLLDAVGFKPEADRLFSVGDLIDRGPASKDALQWLRQSWFHACRGNHEQFAIDSTDPEQLEVWVRQNGGEWWLDVSAGEQALFRETFQRLPMAIEVATRAGTVGIVHADVPPGFTWDEFAALLEAGDADAAFYALWSRGRIQGLEGWGGSIAGQIERVYCGHTPTRGVVRIGNVWFIDTGAVYCYEGFREARLTMVEIHPSRHHEYSIETAHVVSRAAPD
jgi:serine/threonine protein phosphatase 1